MENLILLFCFSSNNNDNNNIQDSGNVQGTSQDVDLMSTSMTMVITIVPPVGPPIPVLVGRAIQKAPNASYEIFLNEELEKDGVYFETQESTKLFPNGTIIYSNGTAVDGKVFFGAVDSRQQRKMHHLHDILKVKADSISLETLVHLNEQRKSKQTRKIILTRRAAAARNFFTASIAAQKSSQLCQIARLKCLLDNLGQDSCPLIPC